MTAHCSIKSDRMIYFVLIDYGPKLGMAWAERQVERTGYANTLADILSGNLAPVVQVIELNYVEMTSRDVTEDFANLQAVRPEVRNLCFAADHSHDLQKNWGHV